MCSVVVVGMKVSFFRVIPFLNISLSVPALPLFAACSASAAAVWILLSGPREKDSWLTSYSSRGSAQAFLYGPRKKRLSRVPSSAPTGL